MKKQNPLIYYTSAEIKEQMSIAGEPDKVTEIFSDFYARLGRETNQQNIPTIENTELALRRLLAELKLMKKHQRQRQHGN